MRKGENIYIRLLSTDDASQNYYHWMNDWDIIQYLESRWHRPSMQDIQNYIKTMSESSTDYLFGIFDNTDNSHIGNVKIGQINLIHRHADIGIIIGEKRAWGKGRAREAIALATNFSFEELNIHKLIAGVYRDNIGSLKAFLKCGYHEVGLLKEHRFCNGKYTDQYLLEIINS